MKGVAYLPRLSRGGNRVGTVAPAGGGGAYATACDHGCAGPGGRTSPARARPSPGLAASAAGGGSPPRPRAGARRRLGRGRGLAAGDEWSSAGRRKSGRAFRWPRLTSALRRGDRLVVSELLAARPVVGSDRDHPRRPCQGRRRDRGAPGEHPGRGRGRHRVVCGRGRDPDDEDVDQAATAPASGRRRPSVILWTGRGRRAPRHGSAVRSAPSVVPSPERVARILVDRVLPLPGAGPGR